MTKLSANELAGHPLVRLIDEATERNDDDPTSWYAVDAWLEARGACVMPLLLQLATDRELLRDESLAGGGLPIAAMNLLERYQDPGLVEPLLEWLCAMPRTRPEMLQWDSLWITLHSVAHFLIGPAIERYQRSDDPEQRARLAVLLGDVQLGHDEVYEVLAAELPRSPCLMAAYLSGHRDPRALPLLLETFDQIAWSNSGEFGERFAGQPMLDLLDAITALEGELSPGQWQTYERAWKLRSPGQAPPSIVPPPRRESDPDHLSGRFFVRLTPQASIEFHQNALAWYGTLRNTASMLDMTPAMIHHHVCTMAGVV